MEKLIDIGINLAHKQFNEDRESVIKRAIEHGVEKMIFTGTSIKASKKGLEYAQKYPEMIYSTAGVHPHDAKNVTDEDLNTLKEILENPQIVAVGECGLDFNRDFTPRDIQEKVFRYQLDLAREFNLPLFLHERDAQDKFLEIMDDYPDLIKRSVVHCFTGNTKQVKKYVEKGFYIGVTGWICDDKRGKNLQEAVKHIPLDKIMIETDGPYLAPKNLKPRPKNWRNEPMYLSHIAQDIARYMNVEYEVLAKASYENTHTFFNI